MNPTEEAMKHGRLINCIQNSVIELNNLIRDHFVINDLLNNNTAELFLQLMRKEGVSLKVDSKPDPIELDVAVKLETDTSNRTHKKWDPENPAAPKIGNNP